MGQIGTLDLKASVRRAMEEVFDTMLEMQLEHLNGQAPAAIQGPRLVGSVSIAGKVQGVLCIYVSDAFARLMTTAMLGVEPGEIDGAEEIHDVLGEISNMVGGSFKSYLCDQGLACELSLPSITSGSDFNLESRGWDRRESMAFRQTQHVVAVEVFIKPAN
jgi:chemotaxis protein CheX